MKRPCPFLHVFSFQLAFQNPSSVLSLWVKRGIPTKWVTGGVPELLACWERENLDLVQALNHPEISRPYSSAVSGSLPAVSPLPLPPFSWAHLWTLLLWIQMSKACLVLRSCVCVCWVLEAPVCKETRVEEELVPLKLISPDVSRAEIICHSTCFHNNINTWIWHDVSTVEDMSSASLLFTQICDKFASRIALRWATQLNACENN